MQKTKAFFNQHKTVCLLCICVILMLLYLLLQTGPDGIAGSTDVFRHMVFTLGIVLTALFALTGYLHIERHLALHWLALIVIPVLGLCYMTVIPLNTVPDEHSHIRASYAISNRLLHIDPVQENGQIIMRADDAAVALNPYEENAELPAEAYTKEQYVSYWARFGKALESDALTPGAVYIYWPFSIHHNIVPALGLTAGRLLHLGAYDAFLAGRIASLLFYALMVAWAVYLMPVKKHLLFLAASMPMAIQQGMSYSYDCMINALAFLIIALSCQLLFGKERPKRSFVLLFGFLCVLSVVMVFSKQHAYFLLALFPVWVVYKKGLVPKKTVWIAGGICFLLACVLVLYLLSGLVANGFDPLHRVAVIASTFVNETGRYLAECIGTRLGSLDVPTASACIAGYAALLIYALLNRTGETVSFAWDDRLVMALIVCGSYLAFGIGHLLYYTSPEATVIEGLQGRYFLPVMLPLAFLCMPNRMELQAKKDCLLVPAAVLLHFFIVIHIPLTAFA